MRKFSAVSYGRVMKRPSRRSLGDCELIRMLLLFAPRVSAILLRGNHREILFDFRRAVLLHRPQKAPEAPRERNLSDFGDLLFTRPDEHEFYERHLERLQKITTTRVRKRKKKKKQIGYLGEFLMIGQASMSNPTWSNRRNREVLRKCHFLPHEHVKMLPRYLRKPIWPIKISNESAKRRDWLKH